MMPFSRHASRSASDSSNLRVIDEDPLRFGVAGPGPAAVAAANARARRYNNPPVPPAIAAAASSSGGNTPHNADANPPAGLNARRNRQRARNAQQNNNTNNNNNARIPDDPARYYYRRPPSPPARAARGGRRHQDAYQGVLPHLHHHDDDDDEDYHFDEGDFPDELEFEPGMWDEILGGRGDRAARRGHRIRDIQGRVQNIMQLLGFGGHADNAFNPWAGGGGNALPINNMGFNPGNPPKRKVKAYSVRQSHPNFNKKKDGKDGFERDIVPPPEVDEEEAAAQRKAWEEAKQAMEAEKYKEQNEKMVELPQNGMETSDSTQDSSEASSTATSSKNKGKGRALEIDTNAALPTSAAITNISQDDNDDIPVLDLAHGSPNTSGSATSSTLFSGKLSNSTRGTSAEAEQTDDSSELKDSSATTTTATNITAAAAAPSEAPPTKPPTRRVRVPVCTSCSTALYLNQSTKGRPYILVCGHIICRGCLDTATERYKRWTAEEVIEDDADIEVPSSAKDKNGWKGAKLKENFVEVDRSRSSTVADTSASTATRAKDRKGKQKVNMRIGAPGSSSASTTSASASQAGPGPSTSASTSTRTATRASRRNASRPSYADLDGDEEGLPDTNYVPRSAREGQDDEDMDDDIPVPSSSKTTKKKHSNRIESDTDNDSDESVLAELTFPMRNTYRPSESNTDETGNDKGKGKAKAQPNGDTIAGDTEAMTSNNKRKRAKADEGASGATTTATDSKKSTKSSTAAPAKKQKVEKPPLIDHDWLSCPVRECKAGTDLGRPIGSREGAWELFV